MTQAPTITLTPDQIAELHALKSDSGLGPFALLRGARDKPAGLSHAVIQRWLSGHSKRARSDHYDYVCARWKNHPSAALPASRARPMLERSLVRVGLSPPNLMRLAPTPPPGLSTQQLHYWLSPRCKKIPRAQLLYILRLCRDILNARKNT